MAKAKKVVDVQDVDTPVTPGEKQYEVLSPFSDKYNYSIMYLQGAKIVEGGMFDEERIKDLLSRNLIKEA